MTGMRVPRRQRRAIQTGRWKRLQWLAAQQIERAHRRSDLGRALRGLLAWKPLPSLGPETPMEAFARVVRAGTNGGELGGVRA